MALLESSAQTGFSPPPGATPDGIDHEPENSQDLGVPDFLAAFFFPEIGDWQPVLDRLDLPLDVAVRIAAQAGVNGTDFQTELLASGIVTEDALFRALALELGIPFIETVDPGRLMIRDVDCLALLKRHGGHKQIKIEERNGATSFLIAPSRFGAGRLRAMLKNRQRVAARLKITTPQALRAAIVERIGPKVVEDAADGLFERQRPYSAKIVANAWQGFTWGAMLVALPGAIVMAPEISFFAIHVFFSLFFMACVALRFLAMSTAAPPPAIAAEQASPAEMPVYSVLVALYKEAEIVPELVAALNRLAWPKSKLEIKLVCEQDDAGTLEAIRALSLPPHIEIVEVPGVGPRTKPKALAYALAMVRGEFIVLFDAEDDPHPWQLVEAWRRFRASDEWLACVQAPLEIANRSRSGISLMFCFEYAALFRGMLPWLSLKRLIFPLGGTSNHFRRSALEHVLGWDPYNVTEDADLGLRLARFGYRTETISCPTLEDAPEDFATWLPQRTRWFKGWVQTWLVHMRDPVRLLRDLGFGSFLIAQVLFAGMFVSAIAHPILAVTATILVVMLALYGTLSTSQSILLIIDVVNVACGYVSFLLLGWQTLERRERKDFWKILVFTPVYWVMISVAAWRAVWELWRRPHHWEKTPHGKARPRETRLA